MSLFISSYLIMTRMLVTSISTISIRFLFPVWHENQLENKPTQKWILKIRKTKSDVLKVNYFLIFLFFIVFFIGVFLLACTREKKCLSFITVYKLLLFLKWSLKNKNIPIVISSFFSAYQCYFFLISCENDCVYMSVCIRGRKR